jgi:hypothetical protein
MGDAGQATIGSDGTALVVATATAGDRPSQGSGGYAGPAR